MRRLTLQRVFSMFPDGLPGTGLLLLRTAAGGALLLQGVAYFTDRHDLSILSVILGLLTVVTGATLLIGYLTPLASVLAAIFSLGGTLAWFPVPASDLFEGKLTAVLSMVIVIALACLGPGAFSLDA